MAKKKKGGRPVGSRTDMGYRGSDQPKTLRQFASKIKPQRTPDKPSAIAKTRGRVTNLGICRFLHNLFVLNETLPKENKMTNEELRRQLFREFPDYLKEKHREYLVRQKASDRPLPDPSAVNYYRYLYNIGRLCRGEDTPYCSFRYDIDGEKVSTRSGDKRLDAVGIRSYLESFGFTQEGSARARPYKPKKYRRKK